MSAPTWHGKHRRDLGTFVLDKKQREHPQSKLYLLQLFSGIDDFMRTVSEAPKIVNSSKETIC